RTIRVAESRDRGVHFLPTRVVARLDAGLDLTHGHLALALHPASRSERQWVPGAETLVTRISWTPRAGVGTTWEAFDRGAFEPTRDLAVASVPATWSAMSAGVNALNPWQTTLVPSGARLMVKGLADPWGGVAASQFVEAPSTGDSLVYVGVERAGNPFGIWSGREGLLRIQRHPNSAHRAQIGVDLPLVLARQVPAPVRAAAAATEWGVVVAWVESSQGRARIALREVSFDQLCAPDLQFETIETFDR
ncbi:MAG: hypothetical protein AB7I50_23955, partial [Vicinamibacterales bacterium]